MSGHLIGPVDPRGGGYSDILYIRRLGPFLEVKKLI